MAWLRHPALAVLAVLMFVLGMGNFFWFGSEYGRLGCSASAGMVQDGRYLVGNRGVYREVTREEWEASQRHEASLLISHPVAMLGAAYLLIGVVFPLLMGRARTDTAARVAQVRASGPMWAAERCAARIGLLSFRGPLLHVSVYPGGIVLQPLLMPARAILASELLAVEDAPSILGWFGPASVGVKHAAPDVRATVRLHISKESQLASAIRSLLPR